MTNYLPPAYTGIQAKKKIDILFLNLSNLPGRPVYPYAFVQVSALARRVGLSVIRWDGLELSLEHKLQCITQLIKKHQPRAVAFTIRQADSVAADNYISIDAKTPAKNPWFPVEETRLAILHIRQLTDAKIFVGGFNFTVNSVSAAEYLQPDFGILGEPDEFFQHFDEVLQGRTEGISNLLYRADGKWQQNQRIYWGPLDDIEYTEDIIDEIFRFHGERTLRNAHLEDIPGLGSYKETGISIAIEISRGCPCACVFCCEPKVKGTTVQLRNLDVIEAEIHNLLRYGLRYYWFICSELNFAKDHILELAERLIRINETLPHPIFWRSYFLPVKFNKDEFRLLLRSGLLIEQSAPFSTLSDENLKLMREPYRVRHALQHIKNLMELNEEPEFQERRQPRWILWSWLGNPYATLDSIRTTLETFTQNQLDLKFDEADSYPALRVYECLDNLPEEVREKVITITQNDETPKTLIHPSYYYNSKLVEHFGGIGKVHNFMQYARETFLSRYYRLTRNWRLFAQSIDFAELEELMSCLKNIDWESIQLPPWVEHPDLGILNPIHWQEQAYTLVHEEISQLKQLIKPIELNQDEGNAILAFLFHIIFSANRQEMIPVFEKLKLPVNSEGYPPESSYLTVSTLIKSYTSENLLFEAVKPLFSIKQMILLCYYFYAIDVRLCPEYIFLSKI
jgi:hypothetical protein